MTHNVDFHGNVKIELSPFESDMRKKEKIIRLLMEYEKSYYEDNYQISQYENVQLPFCIIVPSYNNAKSEIYLRNLDSIFMQDYKNYRVVYIDDKSPDKTGDFVNEYIKAKKIPEDKVKVIIN
jgi:cellulose synthase/poly-beta-1,6-N-acetylglucosamine synthase-like glycosyltransferase